MSVQNKLTGHPAMNVELHQDNDWHIIRNEDTRYPTPNRAVSSDDEDWTMIDKTPNVKGNQNTAITATASKTLGKLSTLRRDRRTERSPYTEKSRPFAVSSERQNDDPTVVKIKSESMKGLQAFNEGVIDNYSGVQQEQENPQALRQAFVQNDEYQQNAVLASFPKRPLSPEKRSSFFDDSTGFNDLQVSTLFLSDDKKPLPVIDTAPTPLQEESFQDPSPCIRTAQNERGFFSVHQLELDPNDQCIDEEKKDSPKDPTSRCRTSEDESKEDKLCVKVVCTVQNDILEELKLCTWPSLAKLDFKVSVESIDSNEQKDTPKDMKSDEWGSSLEDCPLHESQESKSEGITTVPNSDGDRNFFDTSSDSQIMNTFGGEFFFDDDQVYNLVETIDEKETSETNPDGSNPSETTLKHEADDSHPLAFQEGDEPSDGSEETPTNDTYALPKILSTTQPEFGDVKNEPQNNKEGPFGTMTMELPTVSDALKSGDSPSVLKHSRRSSVSSFDMIRNAIGNLFIKVFLCATPANGIEEDSQISDEETSSSVVSGDEDKKRK
jgi:hypothetical protein